MSPYIVIPVIFGLVCATISIIINLMAFWHFDRGTNFIYSSRLGVIHVNTDLNVERGSLNTFIKLHQLQLQHSWALYL
eukprot:UN15023